MCEVEVTADTYTQEEWLEIADKLDRLQQEQGGLVHIELIVYHLRRGDVEAAQFKKTLDSDKTVEYPVIRKFLRDNLGCGTHHTINCQHHWCRLFARMAGDD